MTLDQDFCDLNYQSIDGRYTCYSRIGLKIEKDRLFCELKFPKNSFAKYQCLDNLKIQKKADYCLGTFFWPDKYEDKYTCLANEKIAKNSEYCTDKFNYLESKGTPVDPKEKQACLDEFKIPKFVDACATEEEK